MGSLEASEIGKTALVAHYAGQKSCWEWDEEEDLLSFLRVNFLHFEEELEGGATILDLSSEITPIKSQLRRNLDPPTPPIAQRVIERRRGSKTSKELEEVKTSNFSSNSTSSSSPLHTRSGKIYGGSILPSSNRNRVNLHCTIDEERKAGDAGDLMPPPEGYRFQDRILMGFNNSPLLHQFLLKNLKGEVVNLPRINKFNERLCSFPSTLKTYPNMGLWELANLQSTTPTFKMNFDGQTSYKPIYSHSPYIHGLKCYNTSPSTIFSSLTNVPFTLIDIGVKFYKKLWRGDDEDFAKI